MFETKIQLGAGQGLTLVEMARDVALSGWDQDEILIRLHDGEMDDLTIEETEAGPTVSSRRACKVRVPTMLPVTVRLASANLAVKNVTDLNVEQVRGNLALGDVERAVVAEVHGNLKARGMTSLRLVGTVYGNAELKAVEAVDLQNVRGNLRLKGADHLRASRIGGNLQAKEIGGVLDADQVGGNATLKQVGGNVTLDLVAGNLAAKGLTGGARVDRIGGNLALNGELGAGCTYHFKADGNAVVRLPEKADAHVSLCAQGKVLSSVTLADQQIDGKTISGTLGNGGTEIAIEAKGNVMLGGGSAATGAALGEEISRQVEASLRAIDLEAIGRQVGEEMDAAMSRLQVKLESADWERIGVQSQRAVERAMEQMRRNMDRMVEKAARHQERLERKAERKARRQKRKAPRTESGLAAQTSYQGGIKVEVAMPDWEKVDAADEDVELGPDLDEERLSILKMVEQGQISPQEAEMLLDALE